MIERLGFSRGLASFNQNAAFYSVGFFYQQKIIIIRVLRIASRSLSNDQDS